MIVSIDSVLFFQNESFAMSKKVSIFRLIGILFWIFNVIPVLGVQPDQHESCQHWAEVGECDNVSTEGNSSSSSFASLSLSLSFVFDCIISCFRIPAVFAFINFK